VIGKKKVKKYAMTWLKWNLFSEIMCHVQLKFFIRSLKFKKGILKMHQKLLEMRKNVLTWHRKIITKKIIIFSLKKKFSKRVSFTRIITYTARSWLSSFILWCYTLLITGSDPFLSVQELTSITLSKKVDSTWKYFNA
jgi:hypothetical protein